MTEVIPTKAEQEAERVAALHRYDVMDRPPGQDLAGIAALARLVTGAQAALVNFVDSERMWSACAIGVAPVDVRCDEGLCQYVVSGRELIYAPDATADTRLFDNPFVSGVLGNIRLYAAAPLFTPDEHVIGTLCVADERVIELTAEQQGGLRLLAAQLMRVLELRRTARLLTRANTDLDTFAGTVAHDLRNPLAAAAGYAELAEEQVDAGQPAEAKTSLASVQRVLHRASGLTEALLAYARTVNGELAIASVDLNEITSDALDNVSSLTHRYNGSIKVNRLPVIEGDRSQLLQLMQNLFANAVLHSSVRDEPVAEAQAFKSGDGWVITVDDNGPGIPADERDAVFEAFHRGNTDTDGTGLGLSTCKRIAERHEGRIWVEDSPLGGARVCVYLPTSAD